MNEQSEQEFLADLVKLNTAGGHENRVADFLKDAFKKHGLEAKEIPAAPNRCDLIVEYGNENDGPTLGLCGHEDTVAIGNQDDWRFPPLGAVVKGGKMYGRGTSDMKSGLAAEALALMELKDEGWVPHGQLRFMATIAEESSPTNHMQGAEEFDRDGYTKSLDAVIIGEPFDADVVFAHKGSITYAVTSKGKAAHSSTPQFGYNAIDPLIHYYNLQAQYFKTLTAKNPYLGTTTPVVTKISGGSQLNSVPAAAAVYGKIRTIPEIANQEIIIHFQQLINKVNEEDQAQLKLVILGNKRPVVTDPHDPFVQLVAKVGQQVRGHKMVLRGSSAGTDASELTKSNPGMKVVVFGPGNETLHRPNEYVDLDRYFKFIEIYKEVAKAYLK